MRLLVTARNWLIAAAACLLSASIPTTSSAAPVPPEIKEVVTFIFLADAQGSLFRNDKGEPTASGTGFFVGVADERNPNRTFGYLVTAKHVLRASDGSFLKTIYLRLNTLKGDAEFVRLDLDSQGKSLVRTASDPSVDLAVVPAMPSEQVHRFKLIPDTMIPAKDSFADLHIGEGSDVFFTGLFASYYGVRRNNPIARFGRVAMLPEDCIDWTSPQGPPECAQLYLLEVQSWGGNSGSPVFFYMGSDRIPGSLVVGPPEIKLAGVMRGFFNANPDIHIVEMPTSKGILILPNSGIAAVTPSYLLREILYSDELKRFRSGTP